MNVLPRLCLVACVVAAVSSCDILGGGSGGGGGGSGPPPERLDFAPLTVDGYEILVSGGGPARYSIPGANAGEPVFVVATNGGFSTVNLAIPALETTAGDPVTLERSIGSAGVTGAAVQPSRVAPRAPSAVDGAPPSGPVPIPPPATLRERAHRLRRDLADAPPPGSLDAASVTAQAVIGDEETFFVFSDLDTNDRSQSVDARLAYVSSDGTWSLSVWLETGLAAEGVDITDEMIEALADRFLQPGSEDNDTFDWITAVFGDPWGHHTDSFSLSTARRDIHILLHDIGGQGVPPPGEGVVTGLFWGGDTLLNGGGISGSNERLMFYLHAPLVPLQDGTSWDITDFWPEVLVSTITHEFQHMIQDYQRWVRLGGGRAAYPLWFDEMASMVAEDFVAQEGKLGISGPRGVSAADGSAGDDDSTDAYRLVSRGRMPRFNEAMNRTALTYWPSNSGDQDYDNLLGHYAASYSFGAYLARIYGADLFTTMLTELTAAPADEEPGEWAVTEAVHILTQSPVTFDELVRRWGVAILTSNATTMTTLFTLNSGDWINAGPWSAPFAPSNEYRLGSINAHTYVYFDGATPPQYGPAIYLAGGNAISVAATANALFYVGRVPSGGGVLDLSTLPSGVIATVLSAH